MTDYTIEAQSRTVIGKKVKTLRRQGIVPATIYGPQTKPVSIQFPYRPLEIALMNAGGTNVIDITVEGETYNVLARDVQRDFIKGNILHVDFFAPDMTVRVRVDIPVELTGESPVVASREGILLTGTNTVTVEMLPSKLLNSIEIDLSELTELGDGISIGDLNIPDADIINDPEEMIVKIVQPSAARAEESLEGEEGELGEGESDDTPAEPEVIGRSDDEE